MKIFDGSSAKSNTQEAILEATKHWDDDLSPDMLFAFHSTNQNPHAVAKNLSERFPNTTIVGCTTAGEWLTGEHKTGELVLLSITTPNIKWGMNILENLDDCSIEGVKEACDKLLQTLDIESGDLNSKKHFCLSFFDGMSNQEESTIAAMAIELGDIPLLGGSAGDDLKFKATYVIANGKAYQNAAVFVLAESKVPFCAIKHQHFVPSNIDVVITKADVNQRLVYRLDGMPAAQRYAQLLGLGVKELTSQVFSNNPLMYPYGNECYVRAIRQVCKDDSLEFGCAIEEGMVLNLCEHQDMLLEYDKLMAELKQSMGKIKLLLVYNCIYRALEGEEGNMNQCLAEKTGLIADYIIGFNTYGEQWQGLHVNQTLVALALGSECE
ncbi:MAG: FIST N-terminal domain-containing protein [Mariprofundaceae bacterium]|nr:FIST N-terminal domain-containing protein [Mariprofundaceae bacterium]